MVWTLYTTCRKKKNLRIKDILLYIQLFTFSSHHEEPRYVGSRMDARLAATSYLLYTPSCCMASRPLSLSLDPGSLIA